MFYDLILSSLPCNCSASIEIVFDDLKLYISVLWQYMLHDAHVSESAFILLLIDKE